MPRTGYEEVVLLTGYPSFLAKRLAAQILEREKGTFVYAVVRSKLLREAEDARDELPTEHRGRLALLEGDTAAMDLQLSGAEFRVLAKEVDRIHHAAHLTYHGVQRSTAEQVNVRGTAEILEFARHCAALKCLVHHSTASVFGDRTGLVYEDELDVGQRYRTFLEETRARSERLVRKEMAHLPVCIVRPSTIVGDSRTGAVDRFDGPYLLILLIVTSPAEIALPLPGRGDSPLHLVPIDYVVEAAHAIGRDPRAVGKTFHLVDPYPLTAQRIFELVARSGGRPSPRGFIPSNLARALLRTPGLERFAESPRAFVEQLATRVRFDASNTRKLLDGTGITCPPFESYVDKLVNHVRDKVREKRERRDSVGADLEDPLG